MYKNKLYFTGSYVDFSQGTGATKFSGSINQLISGSSNLSFKNMVIDKSGGAITLQAPITITNSLDFVNGNIISETTHLLTFANGSSWLHGGNNSFVSGPVLKIGNSASFTFPTGKGNAYNPISIAGTLNTTDVFLAEYFNTGQTAGDSLADSIKYVYECNYWKLKQTTGSSNVFVTLGWDTACVIDTGLLRIAKWDGAKWADLGRGTFTGTVKGTITSAVSGLQNYYVALANPILVVLASLSSNGSRNVENFYGISGANTFRNKDHDWRFTGTGFKRLQSNVHGLYPSLLKFNAGANGNFLDWNKGWYFDDAHYYKYNQILPNTMFNNKFYDPSWATYDIRLEAFKNALLYTGAIPIFQLNITSSNIDYQLGLLLHARLLNIAVKYVELGGEINLEKEDGGNVRAFPTGTEYAQTAYEWTRRIKDLLGEDVQVGVCAANYQTDSRRKEWNQKIITKFLYLETHAPFKPGPDGMIIHQYLHNIIPDGTNNIRVTPSTPADFNEMFSTPFKGVTTSYTDLKGLHKCLIDEEIAGIETLAPNKYKYWLTEYGMDEANWLVHGSWGGGLFTALQTFLYLEETNITMAVNFTLWSNSIFGDIFVDNNAFLNTDDPDEATHQFVCTSSPCEHSDNNEYSALGHAMKHIGKAMQNAKSANQLTFSNTPQMIDGNGNSFPGLFGWFFSDKTTASSSAKNQLVILNLTNAPITVQLGTTFGHWSTYDVTACKPELFPLGGKTQLIDCMDGNGTKTVATLYDGAGQYIKSSNNYSITIPEYSIVRAYECSVPDLTVTSSAQNICEGQGSYAEITYAIRAKLDS